MNRRALFRAAGSVMLAQSGARWLNAKTVEQPNWDYVIVGAGSAGLPAALFAARRGAKVLLLDAAADIGGTLHLSGGQIAAAGTRLQEALGIADSVDQHVADIMRVTRNLADPDIVRAAASHAPAMVNWLLDEGLQPMDGHPVRGDQPDRLGYSVRRFLWDANAGRAILAILRRALERYFSSGAVQVQLNTRVSALLLTDSGAVEGVRANGRTYRGHHVLITSGGYAMNPDLFMELVGYPAYAADSYPHSLGDGLALAEQAGGRLRGRALHRCGTGSILTAAEFPAKDYDRFETRPQRRLPWEIWVNAEGLRFVREDEPANYARALALLAQPELRYAIVFDEAILNAAPPGLSGWSRDKLTQHFESHPLFAHGDSLEQLALRARLDAGNLSRTVRNFNQSVDRGNDWLGRTHLPQPIETPPFYAITHLGSSATSSTGVVVDRNLRVTDGGGNPIPNLYAAGEVLGSGVTVGNAFAPGMMLTPALALGRYLGESLPIASAPEPRNIETAG